MALQKEIENKARRVAQKQVKKFLESEQLMTLQKDEKPERKKDMDELFGHPVTKQKDSDNTMTFEKEEYKDKMEQLKKLLYDTKPTNPKPIKDADEGTGLPADMSFAKKEREEDKSEMDKLFNTDTNKLDVDSINYETLSADDFANILGESKNLFLEKEDKDDDFDVDTDKDIDVDDENDDKDDDIKNEPEEVSDEEEPEEQPEKPEEKPEEQPEEDVSGVVISDNMLDELIDRILDKFEELGLVVLSVDDDDINKLSDDIENKIKDKANVLSDDEFEESINYQVKNALSKYKVINESLLRRRWENFIREMENGKMEPAEVGEVKESKLHKKNNKSQLKEQLDKLMVNTKISSTKESNTSSIFNDDTIKLLLDKEK